MSNTTDHAAQLTHLLNLSSPPVGVSFDRAVTGDAEPVAARPAGCCFWEPAQTQRLHTAPSDHANCSVGSFTHGLIPLAQAAQASDTAALVGSGWVGEDDLAAAPSLPFAPSSITYQPLAEAVDPDVVLITLTSTALMTLMGALPDVRFARKPQCVIVPLAHTGQVAVSPGCAVSRTRTGLSAELLTCAIPARRLDSIIEQLDRSAKADRAVSEFAAVDMAQHFGDLVSTSGRAAHARFED
jgi:uncharacterized protein (DUF169 family)